MKALYLTELALLHSVFMLCFFALFILNLIPYIPIEGFQQDFKFVSEGSSNTYYAIENIVNDILIIAWFAVNGFYIIYFLDG
jgi:hypothetical protein